MGSIKLTAANNQRNSPYNNEQKRLSLGVIRNGYMDSAFVEVGGDGNGGGGINIIANNTNNCLDNKDDGRYRQRFVSVSSQSTLTTISKADGNGVITKTGDCSINNNIDADKETQSKTEKKGNDSNVSGSSLNSQTNDKTNKLSQSLPASTLSTIAEKLRRKVLIFKSASNSSPGNSTSATSGKQRDGRKLEKGNSVDSAHTNTISNSSLQEVDDDEFESTELAKYMGQINNEIR